MGLGSRAWVKPFTKEGLSWLPFNPLKGKREIRERKNKKNRGVGGGYGSQAHI